MPLAPQPRTAQRRKRRGPPLPWLLLVFVLLAAMLFSAFQIISILLGYRRDRKAFDALADQMLVMPTAAPEAGAPLPEAWPQVDWARLQALNSDIVGWLYCPGTPVNYPVLQAADNDYYLRRSYDRTPNRAGSLFADHVSVPGQPLYTYIIYGHHMNDGSMFTCLNDYDDQAYYEEHPAFYFLTPAQAYRVDLVAAYRVDAGQEQYPTGFADENTYRQYLDNVLARSWFTTHTPADTAYQLMLLSTCSSAFAQNDTRTLVQGLMVPVDADAVEAAAETAAAPSPAP